MILGSRVPRIVVVFCILGALMLPLAGTPLASVHAEETQSSTEEPVSDETVAQEPSDSTEASVEQDTESEITAEQEPDPPVAETSDEPVATEPPTDDSTETTENAAGNTPVGDNVRVELAEGSIVIEFASVSQSGDTTATVTAAQALPVGYDATTALAYDVTTTAAVSGDVVVCVSLGSLGADATLFSLDGGIWADITGAHDPLSNRLCGTATTVGTFAIAVHQEIAVAVADGGEDGNTPAGTDVLVDDLLGDGFVSIRFSLVTESGETAAIELNNTYPDPVAHDLYANPFVISTDALFTGQATVCYALDYLPDYAASFRMIQLEDGDTWVEIPSTVTSSDDSFVICSSAGTLGLPFAVGWALSSLEISAFAFPGGPLLAGEPFQLYWNATCAGDSNTKYTNSQGLIELTEMPIGDYCAEHLGTGQTHLFDGRVAGAVQTWTFYASPHNTQAGGQTEVVNVSGLPVTITFSNVTEAGLTTASVIADPFSDPWGPANVPYNPEFNAAVAYQLSTTADYSGSVTVCVTYDPAQFESYGGLLIAGWNLYSQGSWGYSGEVNFPAQTTVCSHTMSLPEAVLVVPAYGATIGLGWFGAALPADPADGGCVTFRHIADPLAVPDIAVCDGDANDVDGVLNNAVEVRPQPEIQWHIVAFAPPAGYGVVLYDPVGISAVIQGGAGVGSLVFGSVGLALINTEVSEDPVTVEPDGAPDGSSITFPNVSEAGVTTVEQLDAAEIAALPELPAGLFEIGGLFFEISTTASFDGNVTICLAYDPGFFDSPQDLALLHYTAGAWEEITTSNDDVAGLICGTTASFSPFAIVQRINDSPGPDEPEEPTTPEKPGQGSGVGSINQLPNTGQAMPSGTSALAASICVLTSLLMAGLAMGMRRRREIGESSPM